MLGEMCPGRRGDVEPKEVTESSSSALIDTVVEYRKALRNLILSAQEAVWLLNLLDLRDHNSTARITLQNAIREAAEVLK